MNLLKIPARWLWRLVWRSWADIRPPRSFWILMLGFAGGSINGVMCADWPGKNDVIHHSMGAMLIFLTPAVVLVIRDKPNIGSQTQPPTTNQL